MFKVTNCYLERRQGIQPDSHTHLHGNLEGINPKGTDGRSGQVNGKAKIKLRMDGGKFSYNSKL